MPLQYCQLLIMVGSIARNHPVVALTVASLHAQKKDVKQITFYTQVANSLVGSIF